MEDRMKRLREKLLLLWKRILQAYADYRVTVSAVAFLTIYGAVEDILYILDNEVRENLLLWKCFVYSEEIFVGLLLFICGAMFTESFFSYAQKEKKVRVVRLFCFLAAAVLAAVICFGMSAERSAQIFRVSGSQIRGWSEQFALGYALLLLLGTVYLCHRKSGVEFDHSMCDNGGLSCIVHRRQPRTYRGGHLVFGQLGCIGYYGFNTGDGPVLCALLHYVASQYGQRNR